MSKNITTVVSFKVSETHYRTDQKYHMSFLPKITLKQVKSFMFKYLDKIKSKSSYRNLNDLHSINICSKYI